ncbi:MAG: hypothetical protein AAF928_13980 [Myxococcota bacterium]
MSKHARGLDQEPDPLRAAASRRQFRASRPSEGDGGRGVTVSALAVADFGANAVGPVRLTCRAGGLALELVQVGRFAADFAMAGLADKVVFTVPYRGIRGLVRRGEALQLSLDPHVATPFNRFTLVQFANHPPAFPWRALRLRRAALGGATGVALAVGAVVAWFSSWLLATGSTSGGATSAVASWLPPVVGVVAALVVRAPVRRWARRLTGGGRRNAHWRDRFERGVTAQMGLGLAPELGPERPIAGPLVVGRGLARPAGRLALMAGLATVAASVALVTVREMGIRPERIFAAPLLRVGFAPRVRRVGDLAVEAAVPTRPTCACALPDAPLWREAFSEVAILVQPVVPPRGRTGPLWLRVGETYPLEALGDDEEVTLDLAVVNNGRRTFEDIDLVLTFARRTSEGRRTDLVERGLHWPRRLRPGASVKWRVEAVGTEMKVEGRYDRRITPAELAPPVVFDRLAAARLPVVRWHAAVMLAYGGAPRGYDRAVALVEGVPSAAEPARRQLASARAPLRLCDVRIVPGEGLRACVFNGSGRLHKRLRVRPSAAAGRKEPTLDIEDIFVPGTGLVETLRGEDLETTAFVVEAGP